MQSGKFQFIILGKLPALLSPEPWPTRWDLFSLLKTFSTSIFLVLTVEFGQWDDGIAQDREKVRPHCTTLIHTTQCFPYAQGRLE